MKELVELLQADRKTRSPRYPVQALPALRDSQVTKILEGHLAAGARLVNIRALPYEATLGLIPVVFELEPSGGVVLRRPSVLTLVDGSGHVTAVIDGFDPAQPNPYYVPPDLPGAQPFVFLDESAADTMSFSEADLMPGWNRTHEYVRSSVPAFSLGQSSSDDTLCSKFQNTMLGATPTISGGLFVKTVDDHKTFSQPDMYSVVDDCIVIVDPL